ncbi:unnamed protein product [Paramecium pentaurelia]|uniref:Protein kinase domain-containing protein n=1 Tax=Paramecium pentaurelia TaxID=43138 RepID=A0A8S1XPQ3_9CILI|nr:unnamed protein product [Paramecium pentaurelia]
MDSLSQSKKFSDYYKIDKNKSFGNGQYGEVYACEKINDNNNNEKYCVKIIPIMQKENNREQLINETIRNYTKNNPQFVNIVQTFDTFQDNYSVYIVMEQCEEDLSSEFERMNEQKIWYTEQQVFDIIRQIITALKELYNLKIIHRDIKPENILIKNEKLEGTEKKIYKIGDFGVGKIIQDTLNKSVLTKTGTLIYAAPQMIFDESCTEKCDIFSYGILFYQICYKGQEPYDCIPKINLIKSLKQLKDQPFKTPPLNFSRADVLKDLIEKMIVYQENQRASFEDIFNHPVMNVKGIEETDFIPKLQNSVSQVSVNFREKKKQKTLIDDVQIYQKLLEVLYNRFKICEYVIKQINSIKQNYALLYIIHLIAKYQLEYALAIVYIRPQDFHPSIKQDNDILDLVYKLDQVQKGLQNCNEDIIKQYQNYQKEIQNTYHKFNLQLSQFLDTILTQTLQKNLQFQGEVNEIFQDSKYRKIEILKLYYILSLIKNQQSATMRNDIQELLNQIINFETQYPINLYKSSIDLNEKFPIHIIQKQKNESL